MEQVGRYQIIEELGRGAHGVVYKAMDPAIRRTVAIKSIALGSAIEEDRTRVREGILREARLAGTLSHPNIVTVYDVQDNGDSAYIFMEFVDGKSLEWAISSTRARRPDGLSRAEFIAIFRQVAGALDYAHRKGIIHRDVKPANILLSERLGGAANGSGSGELLAKIADFGVAKFASPEVTQSLIGTPNYMSPEQVAGAAVTGASDQFSLAVIAYEVLTGRKAFVAESLDALLYKIRNEREEAVDKVNPALSQTVRKVMQCAMAKNPAQRFGSCGEFAGALEFALGESRKWAPGEVENVTQRTMKALVEYDPPEEPEPGASDGRKKLALIAVLCAAVALALVLIVRMNSGPPVPTQVLDTKSGTVSPPPSVSPQGSTTSATPPVDLSASQSKPTVVEVPTPIASAPGTPVPKAISRRNSRRPGAIRALKPLAVAAPMTKTGEIQLLTDPPGANVVVDQTQSCVTPCSVTLSGGRHTLTASMDGFGVSRRIFHFPEDSSIFIPMVRSLGVLVISSQPSGANVQVDGKAAGTTPVTLRLPPGSHRVSVWDGTRWRDQNVELQGDEVHTRTFVF